MDLTKNIKTIKFDYKISAKQIDFLDRMVYKDQQHKIQKMIFCKPADQQIYLHAQSNDPKSFKNSIPYSPALCIKTICSTTSKFNKNCDIVKKIFNKREYSKKFHIQNFQIIAWLSIPENLW